MMRERQWQCDPLCLPVSLQIPSLLLEWQHNDIHWWPDVPSWAENIEWVGVESMLATMFNAYTQYNRCFSRPLPPLRCLAKSPNSTHAHWVVGKCDNLKRALSLRKCSAFTNHPCADFGDFAKQRNGSSGREKDLYRTHCKQCPLPIHEIMQSSSFV
jgi:hypothetical protein